MNELLCIKIYTDTNDYQSGLRRSHWKSATNKQRHAFYTWALQLYKTALFHSKPIVRWTFESNVPLKLYHGMNKVFIFKDCIPKYSGPTSTTTREEVAHSFSNQVGMVVTIKPSFNNKFKCCMGMSVSWISHHKNEEEVLLMDQYLPITSIKNFSADLSNNVDHFLFTLKQYKKPISNKRLFENILGFKITETMIDIIKKHQILYDIVEIKDFGSVYILNRLVNELKINDLELMRRNVIFSSKLQCTHNIMLNMLLFRIQKNASDTEIVEYNRNDYKMDILDSYGTVQETICFQHDEDIIFTNSQSIHHQLYKIFIRNESLFKRNNYLLLNQIEKPFSTEINILYNNLEHIGQFIIQSKIQTNQISKLLQLNSLDSNIHDKEEMKQTHNTNVAVIHNDDFKLSQTLSADYTLIWNMNKQKISNEQILNDNHFIYHFNTIKNIQLLIPYNYNEQKETNKLSLYIKPVDFKDFLLFKQFNIDIVK
eukprot:533296_1